MDGSPPDAPNNLIIHEQRQPFTDLNGTHTGRLQNVHYHANPSCVRWIQPAFVSSLFSTRGSSVVIIHSECVNQYGIALDSLREKCWLILHNNNYASYSHKQTHIDK